MVFSINWGEFNLINNQLLEIENFMSKIYDKKFLKQFNQNLTERPSGAVLGGVDEAVELISFFNTLFTGDYHIYIARYIQKD
jgi:hypothetical protein